ncbi:Ubiquitin family protein [Trichomonas vaginalis G3]|uniref:Ubiquitin family protein n=1 Tax=Trichomonas vaginalis (strain ATCC PRA-98 / G3) TaxID=412133 RepID=A2ESV4_TRIV3|nr:FI07626P-related family [Trichomonas vaginalis G3]EAY04280.1 Ubiquitin family protein [Trichomonas vaginalis G3]KAI5549373.1 FI07626P-related family [Trichomonas vaginalis G3]|eukprot:XP_001316503.1 Ubiquitin family protein [Trichomonas vaginalis G3]
MEGTLTLTVRLGKSDTYTVNAWSSDTVNTVKELLVEKTSLQPNQMRLVFAGKVLSDEITLQFYEIVDGSKLYLVPDRNAMKTRQNPKQMIIELRALIKESQVAHPSTLRRILRQLKELISNSLLLSFASISSEAFEAIEDAQSEIEKIERVVNDESSQYLAQTADSTITQIESTSDGLRTLQAIYNDGMYDMENHEEYIPFEITIIPDPTEAPSEEPLPSLYNDRLIDNTSTISQIPENYDEDYDNSKLYNRNLIRQKYAQQVAILKQMGFVDEQFILQALGESNGNIQMAVQILQNKSYFPY